VFAGLAFLLGLSWLFFRCGWALGVIISGAADLEQGSGLEIGAIVWREAPPATTSSVACRGRRRQTSSSVTDADEVAFEHSGAARRGA
jgi:hypothetical protein